MIFCYLVPICCVYLMYNSNNSVSSIICNQNCQKIILCFMLFMGLGTMLYEIERSVFFSIIIMAILLIGIYGLLCFDETSSIHYLFGTIVFTAILSFMARHCGENRILWSSFLLEIVLLVGIIMNMNHNIFYAEVLFILNFAVFYLYLHFIHVENIEPPHIGDVSLNL